MAMTEKRIFSMEVVAQAPGKGGTLITARAVIGENEISVKLFRSERVGGVPGAVALPAGVFSNGVELWSFKKEQLYGFSGIAKMAYPRNPATNEHELVIALLIKGKGDKRPNTVIRVLPLADLAKATPTAGGNGINFLGLRPKEEELWALRDAAAEELNANSLLTKAEEIIAAEEAKRAEEARIAAERAAEEEARQIAAKKATAKEARRQEILARPTITVVLPDGQTRFGIPVTETEVAVLPEGQGAVIVSSCENGVIGDLLSFCFVKKSKGGEVSFEGRCYNITYPRLREQEISALPTTRLVTVLFKGRYASLPSADKDVIRKLAAGGLNGGTLMVVADSRDANGDYTVVALEKGESVCVGTAKIVD